MIKVLLAEDHQIVRDGIKSLLEKERDMEVVGEAGNGQEVLDKIAAGLKADVILADMNMPDVGGIVLLQELQKISPNEKVLFLSMFDNDNYVLEALKNGASGYLLKNINREEMAFAIRHVAGGGKYICSEMSYRILSQLSRSRSNVTYRELPVDLSKREVQILALIAEGLTNSEIAEKLYTSKRTVEGHRQNLIDKTGARNTAALIRYAVKQRIID